MIQIITSVIISALVTFGVMSVATPPQNLGTGSNIQYTGSLIPTRDDFWTLGTTTAAYKSADIGVLTVDSCTGCSAGSNADLQDAYNNSAVDGNVYSNGIVIRCVL